jgi:diguanylate cyclase (GGDEF)-like protein/PAS domain S-box-containing protein
VIGASARILIVDDEAANRKLLDTLLRAEGYGTLCVASGEAALAAIAESAPDLVLLDVMMPAMDGYQVAAQLKANPATANIPIIMVTAHIDRGARLAGLDAGAEEFLTKPVDRAELWLRVRNLLRLKAFGDFLRDHATILEAEVEARTADLRRFRSAMDATADAITLVDRATMRYVEVNATACNMLGYSREEFFALGPVELGAGSRMELEAVYDALIAGHCAKHSCENRYRRKDGSCVQVEVHRHAQRSGDDWIIVGVVRDITERREAEKLLHRLAHYDSLTGLPNRGLFNETLTKTLAHAARACTHLVVLCIDLDNFKNVNDTLGHASGDDLLTQFSARLVQGLRIRDTIGRLGGDEFAVVLQMNDGPRGAAAVARKIQRILLLPFDLGGHEVTLTASVGIAMHPHDSADAGELLRFADIAMYRAKQAGRNTWRFFTAQMNVDAMARLEMETALRRAVKNEEFVLHYQPKVELKTGRVAGLEALLRWARPGHGLVPPNAFIPVLEATGLIVPVGRWVIATACEQIAAWRRTGIGPLQISVNVSGRQLAEGELEREVGEALAGAGISGDLLELELTESSLMANTERTIECLSALQGRGVQISIDDFGTGYSSLAYLRRLPVDKLKIDIAFVRNITTSADDAAIALAIIDMAHTLKLEVVAEGVETLEQLTYLRHHGCDHIQGYYFSRPLALPQLEELLRSGKRLAAGDVEAKPAQPNDAAGPSQGGDRSEASTYGQ